MQTWYGAKELRVLFKYMRFESIALQLNVMSEWRRNSFGTAVRDCLAHTNIQSKDILLEGSTKGFTG